jgi:hypothetical protein
MAKAKKLIRKAGRLIETTAGYDALVVFRETVVPSSFVPFSGWSRSDAEMRVYRDYLDSGERTDYRKVAQRFLEAWRETSWAVYPMYSEHLHASRALDIRILVNRQADLRCNRK